MVGSGSLDEAEGTPMTRRRVALVAVALLAAAGLAAAALRLVAPPAMSAEKRGPYRIAYKSHLGDYGQVSGWIQEVWRALAVPSPGVPAGVYYDDPAKTPANELRSDTGFVVEEGVMVPMSLEVRVIPERLVLTGLYQGPPWLTSLAIYYHAGRWMEEHGYRQAGPTLEMYPPSEDGLGVKIVFEIPIAEP
jgi:hypothetical protein